MSDEKPVSEQPERVCRFCGVPESDDTRGGDCIVGSANTTIQYSGHVFLDPVGAGEPAPATAQPEIQPWMIEVGRDFLAQTWPVMDIEAYAQALAGVIAKHAPRLPAESTEPQPTPISCYVCKKPIEGLHGVGKAGAIHWECYEALWPNRIELAAQAPLLQAAPTISEDMLLALIGEVGKHYQFDEDTNVSVLEGALQSAYMAGVRAAENIPLSQPVGNCICAHGYASTCPLHGDPSQTRAIGREDADSSAERQQPSKLHNEGSNPSSPTKPVAACCESPTMGTCDDAPDIPHPECFCPNWRHECSKEK